MRRTLLSLLFLLLSVSIYGQDRSSSIVTIGDESFYVHNVQQGETIYSLARLYNVPEDVILRNNPQVADGLRDDHVLKIPVVRATEKLSNRKRNRLFDTHMVSSGETLYSIANRYGISVSVLTEDNEELDPTNLSIGRQLNIRKRDQGETDTAAIDEQFEEYTEAINRLETGFRYHFVEPGETLFGLSVIYDTSVEDIISNNNIVGSLRAGTIIKIPDPDGRFSQGLPEQVEPSDSVVYIPETDPSEITMRERSPYSPVEVALLLPLKEGDGAGNRSYLEFYQGFLLGLEDVKASGVSANVSLYNTGRSEYGVQQIVSSPDFSDTELIVGPVYEDMARPALDFAEQNGIPVVSPLGSFSDLSSPLLYQMAPDARYKAEKIRSLLSGDKNIVFVTTNSRDTEFEAEVVPYLPQEYTTVTYASNLNAAALGRYMSKEKENILIVSSTNEFTVDEILAKLSSMQSNLSARSIASYDIRVMGTPRWARFKNIDKNLFFKLKFTYITSYHADRGNGAVRSFDKRYISSFGSLPSLYSYRGYDAAVLFVTATAGTEADFVTRLNSVEGLLEMEYDFTARRLFGSYVNTRWALVCYNNDYTIELL